jgi:hypothetical protein
MQGIYTYIPETNNVPREYIVAAILLLLLWELLENRVYNKPNGCSHHQQQKQQQHSLFPVDKCKART